MTDTAKVEEQGGILRRAVPEDGADEVKGAQRVILRNVEVVVLDDLSGDLRAEVGALLTRVGANDPPPVVEAWIAVAARTGTPESTVAAYAGKSGDAESVPGTYKAVPYGAWFVRTQRVEPPLG